MHNTFSKKNIWWLTSFCYGLPLGLGYNAFIRFLPLWLKEEQFTNTAITLTNLLLIPFLLRSFSANFLGFKELNPRKSFLLIFLGLITVPLATPNNITFLIIGAFIGCLGIAYIETCNGIYAINIKHHTIRSRFKTAMYIGYRAGGILTKSLGVYVAFLYQWQLSYILTIVFMIFPFYMLKNKTWNQTFQTKPFLPSFKKLLQERSLYSLFFVFFCLIPDSFFDSTILLFWMDYHIPLNHIALAKGLFATAGSLVGALLALKILNTYKINALIRMVIPINIATHMLPIIFIYYPNIYLVHITSFITHLSHATLLSGFLIYLVAKSQHAQDYDLFIAIWYCAFLLASFSGLILYCLGNSWTMFFTLISQLNWISFFIVKKDVSHET